MCLAGRCCCTLYSFYNPNLSLTLNSMSRQWEVTECGCRGPSESLKRKERMHHQNMMVPLMSFANLTIRTLHLESDRGALISLLSRQEAPLTPPHSPKKPRQQGNSVSTPALSTVGYSVLRSLFDFPTFTLWQSNAVTPV